MSKALVFLTVPCVSLYRWVHFSRAVLFCQPHQQLFPHSSDLVQLYIVSRTLTDSNTSISSNTNSNTKDKHEFFYHALEWILCTQLTKARWALSVLTLPWPVLGFKLLDLKSTSHNAMLLYMCTFFPFPFLSHSTHADAHCILIPIPTPVLGSCPILLIMCNMQ